MGTAKQKMWVYTTNTMGVYETTTLTYNRRIRFTQSCKQKDMDKHNQSNQTKGLRYTQTKLNDVDIHNQTDGYENRNGYTI